MTITGPSYVAELQNGSVTEFDIAPEDAGIEPCRLEDLKGGAPEHNAAALRSLLDGETGPYRDIVLYNSAAALMIADRARDLADGVEQAADSIDSGAAAGKLGMLIEVTNRKPPDTQQ